MSTKKFSVSPTRGVELRVPVLVEPARAEGVGHRRDEGTALAPAGLAAQADAVDVVVTVGHLARRLRNEVPGRRGRHFQPGLVHQVGAVHDHRAFAVERRGVQRAVVAQAACHGGQDVADIVIGAEIVKRYQPAVLAPDRRFVHADGHDVESTALCGDVGRHALTKHVLFQRHPLDLVSGLCGKIVGESPACGSCHHCSPWRLSGYLRMSNARHHQCQGAAAVQKSFLNFIVFLLLNIIPENSQQRNIFSRQSILTRVNK